MKNRTTFFLFVCLCLTAPLFAQGPPAESGIVDRGEYYDIKWYEDLKRNYTAFHGVDIEAWCAEDPNAEWGVWQYQDVWIEGDPEYLIKTTEHGDDMPTSVWPLGMVDPPDGVLTFRERLCPNVEATNPIAEGTADVVITDNDLTGGLYEPTKRRNAFHLSAHGVLFSFGDEEPMQFSGGYNCQWPGYPADYNETEKCKTKIVLN
jgi:hypothetical protein